MHLDWMAWTWASGAFFGFILLCLATLTVLAIRQPERERIGILGIATTRGDRLFISLLGAAFLHLAWIALFGAGPLLSVGGVEISRLLLATLLSFAYAAAVFRWV